MVRKLPSCPPVPVLAALLLLVIGTAPCLGQGREHRLLSKYKTEIQRSASTLDSIKAELDRGRERVAALRKKEKSSASVLKQLERNIATAENYLQELEAGIDTMDARVGELAVSLSGQRTMLSERQDAMRRRLVSMYKASVLGPLSRWAGLFNPTELLRRAMYFRRLKAYDDNLLISIQTTKARIENDKSALELVLEEQRSLHEEKKKEQARLLEERMSRAAMLADIKEEKSAYLERIAELQASQKQLMMILKQLESRKAAAAADLERALSNKFAKRKGKLAWPVNGAIARAYGRIVHPVYKTVTMNNGIDIAATPGVPVRAVAPGTVAYVGRMRGLGRFIVVDHYGGYLTIYANLGSIRVGAEDEVVYGTTVGTSGPADASGVATVHFEVRKSTTSLDPMDWLENQGPS